VNDWSRNKNSSTIVNIQFVTCNWKTKIIFNWIPFDFNFRITSSYCSSNRIDMLYRVWLTWFNSYLKLIVCLRRVMDLIHGLKFEKVNCSNTQRISCIENKFWSSCAVKYDLKRWPIDSLIHEEFISNQRRVSIRCWRRDLESKSINCSLYQSHWWSWWWICCSKLKYWRYDSFTQEVHSTNLEWPNFPFRNR